MTATTGQTSGFAVFSSSDDATARRLATDVAGRLDDARVVPGGQQTYLVVWGSLRDRQINAPILVCRAARTSSRDIAPADIDLHRVNAASDPTILPPFAAIEWDFVANCFMIEVDWLGLRHIYLTEGSDWTGVSSSALLLAGARGGTLSAGAIGTQALLGWQLGLNTPFAEVTTLAPGSRVRISHGQVTGQQSRRPPVAPALDLDAAAAKAAQVLREFVTNFLLDHPDTVLQLTGGHDSRILLGAIPRRLRSGVEALTLAVPGSPDVDIAARIAGEQGMKHRVLSLAGLESISDEQAHDMCMTAALDLNCSADPLAFAALCWVDSLLDHRPRLAGLGGEVARGFYYFGPPVAMDVSRRLSTALARWRMFPNEQVDSSALDANFARAARVHTTEEIHQALSSGADSWWPATDEFYLWQRMHRWAGVLASATCFDREVVNPMLDHSFIEIARALPPSAKRNMRFLSRILLELDPALADIELDNRPCPRVYSHPTPANRMRLGLHQSRKVVAKAKQRLSRQTHPAAGTTILAGKVISHWRSIPEQIAPAYGMGVFNPQWLDGLLAGEQTADPSTVGLLLNLMVAHEAVTSGSLSRNS